MVSPSPMMTDSDDPAGEGHLVRVEWVPDKDFLEGDDLVDKRLYELGGQLVNVVIELVVVRFVEGNIVSGDLGELIGGHSTRLARNGFMRYIRWESERPPAKQGASQLFS